MDAFWSVKWTNNFVSRSAFWIVEKFQLKVSAQFQSITQLCERFPEALQRYLHLHVHIARFKSKFLIGQEMYNLKKMYEYTLWKEQSHIAPKPKNDLFFSLNRIKTWQTNIWLCTCGWQFDSPLFALSPTRQIFDVRFDT